MVRYPQMYLQMAGFDCTSPEHKDKNSSGYLEFNA